jgi:hypothetical protein
VRCVHGQITASGDHYTITNGTVHDNWTGLTWIQSLSGSSMLPSTVSSYCASQTLDGGGWRAPSVNEVETLFGDYSSPDTVQMDPTAFPAGADIKIGTVDTFPSEGDGGAVQWMYVIDALTGIQEDVNYFIPLPGEEPASGYWVYAQCVR